MQVYFSSLRNPGEKAKYVKYDEKTKGTGGGQMDALQEHNHNYKDKYNNHSNNRFSPTLQNWVKENTVDETHHK